jgi:hypothetical protein
MVSLHGALVMAAGVATAACSPFGGGAFSCDDSAQCGAGGVCEPTTHACSFVDPACLSGRSYGPGSGPLTGVCVGDEPPDASIPDAGGDAPPPIDGALDGRPPVPFCDPLDPTLRLCLELEGTATDGSGSNNTPTTTAIAYAPGQVGQGVVVTDASRIEIAETPTLDVAHITIETWLNVTTLPATGRHAIVDNNGQWGLFINPAGDLRWSPGGTASVPGAIVTGEWIHVAVTYDGATALIYVDGVVGLTVAHGSLATGGGSGTSIAGDNPPPNDRLIGMIDQFRIFSEARTATQVCAAAGLAVCP